MNCAGNGFSVGNLATVTISGTVPYKNNLVSRNSPILLYVTPPGEQSETLIYVWFMKDYTVYDNSSITFTGVDVMAFVSNNYAINAQWLYNSSGEITGLTYDTIGTQFQTAATTLGTLSGITVTINPNSSDTVKGANQGDFQTSWSIKALLEASAKFDAVNYYTSYTSVSTATLVKVASASQVITECAPLSVGGLNPTINRVTVSASDSKDIKYDYHGQQAATAAGTMTIVTPFIKMYNRQGSIRPAPDEPYETQFQVPIEIEPTNCDDLVDDKFGEVFSCQKVFVGMSEFLTPMAWMYFPGVQDHRFCLNHAQYQLTTMGIYASVSGGSRNISDYEYVGTTEKRIRNKIDLDQSYGEIIMTREGLCLTPTIPPRESN